MIDIRTRILNSNYFRIKSDIFIDKGITNSVVLYFGLIKNSCYMLSYL